MIVKSIDNVIAGLETQARYIVKPGEYYDEYDKAVYITTQGGPFHWNWASGKRLKWQVGRDYSVSQMYKPGVWWHPATGEWKLPTDTIITNSYPHYVDAVGGVEAGWQPLRIVVMAIRREPLQAISEADAIAEGCKGKGEPVNWDGSWDAIHNARDEYRDLWESINGRGSWDANPDVWVIEFGVQR